MELKFTYLLAASSVVFIVCYSQLLHRIVV